MGFFSVVILLLIIPAELPVVHTNLISYQYNPDNFQPRQITKVVTDRNRSETQELILYY